MNVFYYPERDAASCEVHVLRYTVIIPLKKLSK